MTPTQKDLSTPDGQRALLKTPLKVTFEEFNYPCLTVRKEEWGVNIVLWLAIDDFLCLYPEDSLLGGLLLVAYSQAHTKTPLLLNDELRQTLKEHHCAGGYIPPLQLSTGEILTLGEILPVDQVTH